MPAAIAAAKAQARKTALAARRALGPAAREAASRQICAHLRKLVDAEPGRTVAGFMPMADEADIRPLLENTAKAGRSVCLPRVAGPKQPLTMHKMSADNWQLTTGYSGISEPAAVNPSISLAEVGSLLIPSVSVDRTGIRLGFGRGFYDITIPHMPDALLIAPLFSCQLAGSLPAEDHDAKVHVIVTESGVIDLRY